MTPIFLIGFGSLVAAATCITMLFLLWVGLRGGSVSAMLRGYKPTSADIEHLSAEVGRHLSTQCDLGVARLENRVAAIQENVDWLASDRMLEITSEMARTQPGEKLGCSSGVMGGDAAPGKRRFQPN